MGKTGTTKWKKKKLVLYSAITLCLLLIFLELVSRIVFYFQYKNFHTGVAIQGNTLQTSDSLLVFKNQPFYIDYYKKYQNNEESMKSAVGDVFIPPKTENDFWVLLTGASAMEGMGSNKNGKWLDITGVTDHPYYHTIAFYLQQLLQKQMPDKKVKVFNAANSSYVLYQSYLKYISLADKIKADWVISMDGVNEYPSLDSGENIRDMVLADWNNYPQFHYPLKLIVQTTRHSAFINAMKQKIFHIKQSYRLQKAKENDYPERKKWATAIVPPIQSTPLNSNIQRAISNFSFWINKYDSALKSKSIKHLLLIQPHMSFRDTTNLSFEEKAVNHYYRGRYQNPLLHTFLRSLYEQFSETDSSSVICTMTSVHYWPEWVFVDYCHFTDTATKKIAKEIFNYIASDGTQKPFQLKAHQ